MDHLKWLTDGLARPGKTQRGLAKALGIDPAGVNRLMKGERQLKAQEIEKARRYFGQEQPPEDELEPTVKVPQRDVRAGAGDGMEVGEEAILGFWELPAGYIRSYLGVAAKDSQIIEIKGDSMAPTLLSGDRVMIDTSDKSPSPPGMFALWDGIGLVVKRLDPIPNTDPYRFKIISDNPKHSEYERTLDEISVVGRVVWFARRA